jgi:ABC-type multidrug transport system fused ATPase/permease subunit
LRNPTLLLLDEATSSLDSHNEALILDAVERLHGDISVVIIAHRISTVSRTDHVALLEHDQIVETGTWKDLVQCQNSRLRTMIEG